MRIRRSLSRFFSLMVVPAISAAVTAYFGYYAIWGERGFVQLTQAQSELKVERERLATLRDNRVRLEHRIRLLKPGSIDPDLVEELARGQLLESQPGQVDVPRNQR